MFGPTAYLRWAARFYGRVDLDLASSGMSPAPLAELDPLPALADPEAWKRLRASVAAHNGVSESDALPTLGTTHAIWTAYAALLSPGDEVLVERPAYEPLYRIAEGLGARVSWFVRSPESRFALDPARVETAITARTRVVALSNLHNPSGARASDDALREVARVAAKRGAHVLVDEVYAQFDSMCDAGGAWSGSARHLAPNVVIASSLTKAYGLGAHRIGWVLAPREVIERAEDALTSNLGHPPFSWAAIGAAAFERLPALAAHARGSIAGKRDRVAAWIASRPHLTWSAPREGLFGLAIDARGADLTPAIERAAIESGVLVAPGSFFGVPNGFRLAWSIDGAKLDAALVRLGSVLE